MAEGEDIVSGEAAQPINMYEPVGADTEDMEAPEVFDSLGTELQGKVVLEKPRVPRKVLVKALKQHTISLKKCTKEITTAKARIEGVEQETQEIRQQLGDVNVRIDEMADMVERAQEQIKAVEEKMDEAMRKLDKIDEMEVVLEEHNKDIAQLKRDQSEQKAAFQSYQVQVSGKFSEEAKERGKIDTRLTELEDLVHNNLKISTDQVILGEGSKALTLTVVLSKSDEMITENKESISSNKRVLKKHAEEIAGKAALHVEGTVTEHAKQLKELVEITGAGGGGARMADLEARIAESTKGVKSVTLGMDELKEQMLEKCDKSRVDEKIEAKYEEIIDHLQAALSSAGDDEDEFKRVSMELQEICQQLSTTKADKRDLLEVKEQVLFDSRVREQVEQLREYIDQKMDKDDVLAGLQMKPNREELEKMLHDLSAAMKRSVKKAVAASEGTSAGEAVLSTQGLGTVRNKNKSDRLYANLVWKKGGGVSRVQSAGALMNKSADQVAGGPAFGGGFNLGSSGGMGAQRLGAPALKTGRSAELLPMMNHGGGTEGDGHRTAANSSNNNPSNSFVVGRDGLIYHGAAMRAGTSKNPVKRKKSINNPAAVTDPAPDAWDTSTSDRQGTPLMPAPSS